MDSETNALENKFKIIVIGDSNVGKTNIISRYTKNTFIEDINATGKLRVFTKIPLN